MMEKHLESISDHMIPAWCSWPSCLIWPWCWNWDMPPRSHYKERSDWVRVCKNHIKWGTPFPGTHLFGGIRKGLATSAPCKTIWQNMCWVCQYSEPSWTQFDFTLCSILLLLFLLLVLIPNKCFASPTLPQCLLWENLNFDRSLTLLTLFPLKNIIKMIFFYIVSGLLSL